MGAESGPEGDEPEGFFPLAGFPVVLKLFLQGKQNRRAAHVPIFSEDFPGGMEALVGKSLFQGIEHVPASAVRDNSGLMMGIVPSFPEFMDSFGCPFGDGTMQAIF